MSEENKDRKGTPALNPYVFTALLFLFGLWCFYDGWLSTNPEMAKHRLFNQVISGVLLPWAIYDFFKVRRTYRKDNPEDTSSGNE